MIVWFEIVIYIIIKKINSLIFGPCHLYQKYNFTNNIYIFFCQKQNAINDILKKKNAINDKTGFFFFILISKKKNLMIVKRKLPIIIHTSQQNPKLKPLETKLKKKSRFLSDASEMVSPFN